MGVKSEHMRLIAAGLGEETFVHAVEGTFLITQTRMWLQLIEREPFTSDITPELVEHLTTERDVDPDRVMELDRRSWMWDPAIGVHLPDGTTLLIDGTHRILRRHREGLADFPVWIISPSEVLRPPPGYMEGRYDLPWGRELVDGKLVEREAGVPLTSTETRQIRPVGRGKALSGATLA